MGTSKRDCCVFDIDERSFTFRIGFIFSRPSQRNWDAFFATSADDKAIAYICDLTRHLSKVAAVVLVSRRFDAVPAETEDWLHREIGTRPALHAKDE